MLTTDVVLHSVSERDGGGEAWGERSASAPEGDGDGEGWGKTSVTLSPPKHTAQ